MKDHLFGSAYGTYNDEEEKILFQNYVVDIGLKFREVNCIKKSIHAILATNKTIYFYI